MTGLAKVQEISTASAERVIGAERVERTIVEPSVDSQGAEALRVVVVLKPEGRERITGDQAIDLMVAIRQALSEGGGRPIPSYPVCDRGGTSRGAGRRGG